MTNNLPAIGEDGFYHPATEDEIVQLIKKANNEGLEIRCRGAAHSLARAIYTDAGIGFPQVPNQVSEQEPPKGPNINIMLDNYCRLVWVDEKEGIVEAEAGIHLGVDPGDPTEKSTLDNSFLHQAFLKGWTLSDLGGITHQTVSGFLMTGSAGGTLMYSLDENLLAFRMIDGEGKVEWVEREKDEDLFDAVGLSMGLLGIVSKVRFKLTRSYYLYGQQIIASTKGEKCPIDLFGEGRPGKPSMKQFLEETPYTRLLWWPQKKVERVVIWQASRGAALPVFDPAPYTLFEKSSFVTSLAQLGASILFTLLGCSGFFKIWRILKASFKEFQEGLEKAWGNSFFAWLASKLLTFIFQVIAFPLVLLFSTFKKLLYWLYPAILNSLQPLSKKGKAELFMDYTYRSLPMDNAANDVFLGTEFTEIWVPIEKTGQAMNLLKRLYDEKGVAATGFYSTELYAGVKSNFWMSPAYKQDMFRIDIFWYHNNDGDPAEKAGFFSQFWEAFRDENIPFRLHWGKFLPEYDYPQWSAYMRAQYPRWDDFMQLRKQRDPQNIFLSNYWSNHLFGQSKTEVVILKKQQTELS